MRFAFAALLAAAVLVGAAAAVDTVRLVIPERWNPWAPLRPYEPMNLLTRLKLARLSHDGALCMAVLQQTELQYEPIPDRELRDGCGYRNAVRVEETSLAVGEPFTLSCKSAVALAMWEHHFVAPAALAHFGAAVLRIEHLGTYSCRNIYGRDDAPLSRHATADAIDIAGFVLSNGRRIRVERSWGRDDAEGLFLREVRDGACRVFDSVLGPEYNEAHRNHFHLDRGGFRACR